MNRDTDTLFDNSKSYIKSPILYDRLIVPVTMIIGFLWLIIFKFSTSFVIPVTALIAYFIFSVWKQLEPANLIRINKESQSFILVPRNLLKRLLFKNKTISFAGLQTFMMKETSEIILDGRRYIVFGVLKGGVEIPFYHSEKESAANKNAAILNSVIQSPSSQVLV